VGRGANFKVRSSRSAVSESHQHEDEVYRFIMQEMDSVSQLEGLLLVWHNRPRPWTVPDLAQRLYVNAEVAREILFDLTRKQLISMLPGPPETYHYESKSVEQDQLMASVDATYRREIVRVSTMIHSKPSPAVRDFARAFRFTKEKE